MRTSLILPVLNVGSVEYAYQSDFTGAEGR